MFTEVTTEMKKQARYQASKLEQQIEEMQRLLDTMKQNVNAISEFGPCAMRSAAQMDTPAAMARVAGKMAASTASLALLADMVDAANFGTCEEVGA